MTSDRTPENRRILVIAAAGQACSQHDFANGGIAKCERGSARIGYRTGGGDVTKQSDGHVPEAVG